MDRVDKMFRACSDRTRLRILNLLRDGEHCVGDLVEALVIPQPTASRHLGYLRGSGLVTCRKDGQWALYSLAEPTDALHRALIGCLEPCETELGELKEDRLRSHALRKNGGCCPTVTRRPAPVWMARG